MDYVPDRGDLVWVDFSPQTGHEQAGRRPAVVLSPLVYNRKSGLTIMCPVTSRIKNYSFEVLLPDELEIKGVILSDQVKSLDWKQRHTEYIAKVPASTLSEVLQKLGTLLNI